jgi:hypothetical protein
MADKPDQKPRLSDEQVVALAESFEISEDD